MRSPITLLTRYSLVVALLVLIVAFSLLRPDVFPTFANAGSIMSDNAVLSLVALGVMVPLIVGQFDLSPGFVASLSVMLTAGLMSRNGLPWPVVLVVVLCVGAAIGLLMGVLVGYLGLNSLIVSLGTGSAVSGLTLMYSGGQIIFQGIPHSFLVLGQTRIGGVVPLPFLYAVAMACVIWFVLVLRPVGRKLYAIGGSAEAARLIGIDLRRFTAGAFVASSTMACLAGFVQVARLGAGHPTAAQSLLLPAFAAAFLGATAFRPGFYNVPGTIFAVYLVGTGTTGLFMLGADSYVQPIFNGIVLVIAVTAARLGALRKVRRLREAATTARTTGALPPADPATGAARRPEPAAAQLSR